MGMTFKNLCFAFVFISVRYSLTGANELQADDTVIIEAAPLESIRSSRQLLSRSPSFQTYHPVLLSQGGDLTTALLGSGPCFSSKGQLGKCVPFRQCYPYFKLPELNNFETWVFGMYDTCSYFTAQGRQMFGVCCTTPIVKPIDTTEEPVTEAAENEATPEKESLEGAKAPQYQNWPPPLPTHPPHHTIPPLPTHPPSQGYPILNNPPASKPTTKPPYNPMKPKPTSKPITMPPSIFPAASCGAKNGDQEQERIVGGHNAEIGEWPWIAALFNGGRQFCGGSLIDDSHILSAAHCVAHMSSWDVARLTVRLADYNIKTNSEVKHIEKKVKRVVRHKGFDGRTLYNDIAILTLDTPVKFSNQVRPICLPTGAEEVIGKTATVIGWGSIRESGPQPSVLQEVNIPIWSNNECRSKYGPAAPGGIVEHMLCAGQASRDSCSGDSGGPLMLKNGKWTQVGIVSWGIGCGKGQYPGVYTRVAKFLPWINKNLK